MMTAWVLGLLSHDSAQQLMVDWKLLSCGGSLLLHTGDTHDVQTLLMIIFTGNVVCCVTHWLACCSCVGLLIFVVQPTVGLWISWMKTCKVTLITSSVYSDQAIMNLLVSTRHFIPDSSCQ